MHFLVFCISLILFYEYSPKFSYRYQNLYFLLYFICIDGFWIFFLDEFILEVFSWKFRNSCLCSGLFRHHIYVQTFWIHFLKSYICKISFFCILKYQRLHLSILETHVRKTHFYCQNILLVIQLDNNSFKSTIQHILIHRQTL